MDLPIAVTFGFAHQLGLFDSKLQFTYEELEACRMMLKKPFEQKEKQPISIISELDSSHHGEEVERNE